MANKKKKTSFFFLKSVIDVNKNEGYMDLKTPFGKMFIYISIC